jgi:hypothetical protein
MIGNRHALPAHGYSSSKSSTSYIFIILNILYVSDSHTRYDIAITHYVIGMVVFFYFPGNYV